MGGMRCKVPRAPVAAWLASPRVEAPRSPSWFGKCGANVKRGGPHWHSDETKTGCSPMVVPPSQLCLEFYNGHFVDPCLEKRFPCKGSQPGLLRLPCPMLPLFLALYCSSAFTFVVLYQWSNMCGAWSVLAGEAGGAYITVGRRWGPEMGILGCTHRLQCVLKNLSQARWVSALGHGYAAADTLGYAHDPRTKGGEEERRARKVGVRWSRCDSLRMQDTRQRCHSYAPVEGSTDSIIAYPCLSCLTGIRHIRAPCYQRLGDCWVFLERYHRLRESVCTLRQTWTPQRGVRIRTGCVILGWTCGHWGQCR